VDDRSEGFGLSFRREPARQLMEDRWYSLRPLGWASIVLGVLWIFGFGSFLAVALGVTGILGRHKVVSPTYPPPGLRLCQVGAALGAVGLALTAVWLLVG
jgi:hypothetical protein